MILCSERLNCSFLKLLTSPPDMHQADWHSDNVAALLLECMSTQFQS